MEQIERDLLNFGIRYVAYHNILTDDTIDTIYLYIEKYKDTIEVDEALISFIERFNLPINTMELLFRNKEYNKKFEEKINNYIRGKYVKFIYEKEYNR